MEVITENKVEPETMTMTKEELKKLRKKEYGIKSVYHHLCTL